jgi:hypothetical protein
VKGTQKPFPPAHPCGKCSTNDAEQRENHPVCAPNPLTQKRKEMDETEFIPADRGVRVANIASNTEPAVASESKVAEFLTGLRSTAAKQNIPRRLLPGVFNCLEDKQSFYLPKGPPLICQE